MGAKHSKWTEMGPKGPEMIENGPNVIKPTYFSVNLVFDCYGHVSDILTVFLRCFEL